MRPGRGILGAGFAGLAGLLLASAAVFGHPLPLPAPSSPDTARLGMSEAELRALAGDGLKPGLLSREAVFPPGSSLAAFSRQFPAGSGSDLAYAEYELFRGTVYRIRWRLTERFERPLMPRIVDRVAHDLGPPVYDQLVEATMRSPRASVRRAAWNWSHGTIEVLQLQPQQGGPLFLTWTDQKAVDSILKMELQVPPQPDQLPPWWEGKPTLPRPLKAGEDEPLLLGFEALLASWLKPS